MMDTIVGLDRLKQVPSTVLAVDTRGFVDESASGSLYPEILHHGWALLVDESGDIIKQTMAAEQVSTFFRSSAKPFQAFTWVEEGFHQSLKPQELAIACASHSATSKQVAWVRHLLARVGPDAESCLLCGPQAPIDDAMRDTLTRHHEEPTSIHNNCSGKHAGLLWYCAQKGWDTASYLSLEHPVQQRALEMLARYTGLSKNTIGLGLDGCGLPSFYMPLQSMARLYIALASDPDFEPLVSAMVQYPELVSGPGRIDLALMRAGEGNIVSKVGADGLICVANRSLKQALVLKMADGNVTVRDAVIVSMLTSLQWLNASHPLLESWQKPPRVNTLGQTVGWLHVLPNDVET